MTDSVLRVIIDSTGAQSGAQAVNAALGSITGTATQSIQALNTFSSRILDTLKNLAGNMNFGSMANSFNGALNSMTNYARNFAIVLAKTLSGSKLDLSAYGLGKSIGNAINNGLSSALSGVKNILLDVFSFSAIQSFMQKIAAVGTEVQRFKVVTSDLLGSVDAGSAAFENARNIANRYGLTIESLLNPYMRLIAATSETYLSTQQVDIMFRGISAAASSYHMSQQEVNLVMLAFNQMISKGTVSMEELRRQLGERVFGAFQIAAKAIGKTTDELETLVRTGQLKGPEFAALLGAKFFEKFGLTAEKVAKTYFGAMNRMHNATFKFFEVIANAGVLDAFTKAIETFTNLLTNNDEAVRNFGQSLAELVDQFVRWLKTVTIDDIKSFFNAIATGINGALIGLKWIVDNKAGILAVMAAVTGAKLGAFVGSAAGLKGALIGAGIGGAVAGTSAYFAASSIGSNSADRKEGEQNYFNPNRDLITNPKQVYGPAWSKSTFDSTSDLNPFKSPKPKKGLSDAQKSYRRAESIFESFDKTTRDFFNGLTPRKAVDTVPTRQQEFDENGVKLANMYADAMNRLNDQRRDGQISAKDFNTAEQHIINTYVQQVDKLNEVLDLREQFRHNEAAQLIDSTISGFNNQMTSTFEQLAENLSSNGALNRYDLQIQNLSKTIKGNFVEAQKILNDQMISGNINQDMYTSGIERLNIAYTNQIDIVKSLVNQQKAMDQSFVGGLQRGLNQYFDSVSTISDDAANFVTSTFNKMGDALAEFVNTGKLDFRSLASSILADLVKIQAKMLIMNLFGQGSSSGNFLSLGLSWLSSGLMPQQAPAPVSVSIPKMLAKGGIFDSPSLSAYSGGIYNTPKMFKFAQGAGVFGEAGPEGILPLGRTSKGELGVKMVDRDTKSQPQSKGYRIINVIDPNMVREYMNSSSGEEVILNTLSRNPGAIRQIIGG